MQRLATLLRQYNRQGIFIGYVQCAISANHYPSMMFGVIARLDTKDTASNAEISEPKQDETQGIAFVNMRNRKHRSPAEKSIGARNKAERNMQNTNSQKVIAKKNADTNSLKKPNSVAVNTQLLDTEKIPSST